jgi:peptidyl-prolyl cis-trans isomerase SurA
MKCLWPILILALTLCAATSRAEDLVDGVAAIVNGTVITAQQVRQFAAPAIDDLTRQYAGQPDLLKQKYLAIFNEGLEQLIERQLILDDFTAQGYRLPDSLWDQWVQERIRDRYYNDRSRLMKTLQAQGETFDKFRQDVRDQNIETFMRSKKVAQEITISPYKVEKYYQSHTNEFQVEDEVKLRMISIKKNGDNDTNAAVLAGEILAKIKNGASFADMAKAYSQDSLASQGGDEGWIAPAKLRREFADAAARLPAGQVSGVIDQPDACYLMLVEDKHLAQIRRLDEVRDEIGKNLRVQEQARLEKQWIEQLKTKAFIRYY